MTDIEIKIPYQFLGIRWTKTLRRKFASDINELTPDQLLAYCQTMLEQHSDEGSRKIKLLSRLYQLPMLLLFTMTRVQLAHLTLYLNPLLETPRLTANLFPVLKCKTFWKSMLLYGPGNSLTHVQLGEFIVADNYFEAYQRTQQVSCLEFLIAVLWRDTAGHTYGDKRESFNPHKLEERAKLTASLPMEVKLAIYYYFAGCKSELAEQYDTLFSSDGASESSGDWLDLVRTLPNDKFGTIEECENLYVHTVFDVVNRMMRDQKKSKLKITD